MRGVEHIPWLYDAFMQLFFEPTGLGRWRRRLVGQVRGWTLEVGCGTGRNLPLYPEGARPCGVEPDLRLLLAARRRAPGVPLVVARTEALPFAARSFDTAVSSLVFCSVDDPAHGLGELRRVLKPEGKLRMMEHVRHQGRFLGWLQDVVQPSWTWVTGGCRPNRETEAEVEKAGFRIDPKTRRVRGAMRMFTASRGD